MYWMCHASAILAIQPVRVVVLTAWPEDWMSRDASRENIEDYARCIWPGIAFTLPEYEPLRGLIVTISDDVGSPESVARSLEAMRQAGERLAWENEAAILRSMGIPIDPAG